METNSLIAWNWGVMEPEAILSLEEPPEFISCVCFVSFSTQASWPGPNYVHFSSHVVFESSSHVILESIINHIHIQKSVMTGSIHNILAGYNCRLTSPGMPASTIKSSKDTWGVTITLSSRAIVLLYLFPWPLLVGGSVVPACGPPASLSVYLASIAVTPAGPVHKSRVTMWCYVVAVKEMMCIVYVRWVLQREHSGEVCDLASTLCKYDLGKGDLFVLSLVELDGVGWSWWNVWDV